jgi:hypothetical protein
MACTAAGGPELSGGSGEGDDSAGEGDADTDTDPSDFDYDELTDVVPYDTPTSALATNATQQSLDVIDLVAGATTLRIPLGDRPERVRWDPSSGRAYVVYGTHSGSDESSSPCTSDDGCDNRLDVVDVDEQSVDTITLTVGATRYVATDVALGRDGGVFVLADGDDWWSEESVVEVDAGGAIAAVWSLAEEHEVNAVPLWYDGASIYAEHWRFTFGADPKLQALEEANNYSPDDYDDWNGTPVHTALASDGSGILFPGEAGTVVERHPTKDTVQHEYALQADISYGASDIAYTHGEAHVVTVGLDYDDYRLQLFDRASAEEVNGWSLGGLGTISAETEILIVGSDDAFAWVYVFDSFTDPKRGKFLVAPLGL